MTWWGWALCGVAVIVGLVAASALVYGVIVLADLAMRGGGG